MTADPVGPAVDGGVLRSWVPRFHVTAEHNWLNDPNGLIQVDGEYHVFFQENPLVPFWGPPHWGHVSSRDLVTWTRHERALSPVPGGPDADGCWSGCARVVDGVPYLYYTGVVGDGADRVESVCRAAGSADLRRWTRDPGNPLVAGPPPAAPTGYHRDPFLWRDGDGWHLVLASGTGTLGTVLVYHSPDAVTWSYGGVLFADPDDRPDRVAEHWECPQLLLFPDAAVLVVSVQQPEAERPLSYVEYFVGELAGGRFRARHRGRLDGGRTLYAPAVTVDEQGRHLLWGWAQEELHPEVQRHLPAAGALTLPRVLTLDGDELRSDPAPELSGLRDGATAVPLIAGGGARPLPAGSAGQVVIGAAVTGSGGTVEVRLGDDAGADELRVTLRLGRELEVTSTDATGRPRTHRVATPGGGDLTVYRDGSLVEVFAGGAAVTTRWYAAGPAPAARVRTRGPVTVEATAWLLSPDRVTPAAARPDAG